MQMSWQSEYSTGVATRTCVRGKAHLDAVRAGSWWAWCRKSLASKLEDTRKPSRTLFLLRAHDGGLLLLGTLLLGAG